MAAETTDIVAFVGKTQVVGDQRDGVVSLCQQGNGVFQFTVHDVFVQADPHVFFEFAADVRMAVARLADVFLERFVLVPFETDRRGKLVDPGGVSAVRFLGVIGEKQVDQHGDHQFEGDGRARAFPPHRHVLNDLHIVILQFETERVGRI